MSAAVANDLISLAYFTVDTTTVAVEWASSNGSLPVAVAAYQFLITAEVGSEVRLAITRRSTARQETVYGWYALVSSTSALASGQVFFGGTEASGYGNRDLGVRLTGGSSSVSGDVVIKSSFVDLAVFPAASP